MKILKNKHHYLFDKLSLFLLTRKQNPAFQETYALREAFLPLYKRLGDAAGFSPKGLNSIGIHKFEAGSAGILPHVDDERYANLVSIFVLDGESRFRVCASSDGAQSIHDPA